MDRSEYMTVDADYWYNKGKEDERAKIVAWLREDNQSDDDNLEIYFAKCIEGGEHLK